MTPEEARKFVPAGATVVAAIHSHPCVGERKYYGVSVVSQGIQCYKVTDSHKARLRDAFINRWGNHLLSDCKARFNCKNLVWPWEYKGR